MEDKIFFYGFLLFLCCQAHHVWSAKGENGGEKYTLKYIFLHDTKQIGLNNNNFFSVETTKKADQNIDQEWFEKIAGEKGVLALYDDKTEKTAYAILRAQGVFGTDKFFSVESLSHKTNKDVMKVLEVINKDVFPDEPKSLFRRSEAVLQKILQEKADKEKKEEEEKGPYFDIVNCLMLDKDGNLYKSKKADEGFFWGAIQENRKVNAITLEWARKKIPDLLVITIHDGKLYGIIPFDSKNPNAEKTIIDESAVKVFSESFISEAKQQLKEIVDKEVVEKTLDDFVQSLRVVIV